MTEENSKVAFLPAVVLVIWAIVWAVYFFGYFLGAPLLDHYPFRQTQVATVIRELTEGGPWLAYRMPVFGPPWSVPLEFPIYQILSAKFATTTGLHFETTARLISGLSAGVALLAVWRLGKLFGFTHRTQKLLLILMAFSPLMFYWSHTVMIETLALAASLLMCVCAAEFSERQRLWPLGPGVFFAIIAALAKTTTFALFAIAIFVWFALEFLRFAWDAGRDEIPRVCKRAGQWFSYGLALLGPALVIALIWIQYGDSLKDTSPLTAWLTSDALKNWNYGDKKDIWLALKSLFFPFRGLENVPPLMGQALGSAWPVVLIISGIGLLVAKRKRIWLKIALLGLFLSGPVIFSNLYVIHYYYWVANTVFLLALVALGLDDFIEWLAQITDRRRLLNYLASRFAAPLVVLMVIGSTMMTLHTFFLVATQRGYPVIETIGQHVKDHTSPGGLIYTFGFGWNPMLQYYSDRPMVMARTPEKALDYGQQLNLKPAAVLFCRKEREQSEVRFKHPLLTGSNWVSHGTVGFCDFYTQDDY